MARNVIVIILIVIAIAAGVWLWQYFSAGTPAGTLPSLPSSSSTGMSSAGVSREACSGCVGVEQNGRTIAVVPASRITLELPSALYNKDALTIAPSSSMGETFGASAAQGDWVRTFEAVAVGTTTITVPSNNSSAPPYALTLRIVDAAHAWENGMTIVTQADRAGTVYFPKNERFLIQFGNSMTWTLSFDPSGVVTRVPLTTTAEGFQGVYEANATGTAVLRASGRPICNPGEACAQYIIEVPITFVVQNKS